jgi:hypothetical protein
MGPAEEEALKYQWREAKMNGQLLPPKPLALLKEGTPLLPLNTNLDEDGGPRNNLVGEATRRHPKEEEEPEEISSDFPASLIFP